MGVAQSMGWGRGRVAGADRTRVRIALAGLAAAVVCLATAAPASAAPPQDVADLTAGLGRLATVTSSLTSPGLLGRPLALTSATPGGADGLGFGDLFAAATVNRLSSPQSLSDLADQLSGTVSLSGARSATITATAVPAVQGSTVEGVDLTIGVTRHRSGIPLSIAASSPALSIQSDDGATDDLTAATQLSLRYDTATRDVWLDGAPSLAVDATVTARPSAKAGLGIL